MANTNIPLRFQYTGSQVTAVAEYATGESIPVAYGGTGATTAAGARSSLGLVKQTSGTDTTTGSIVIVEGALAASLSNFGGYYPAASAINIDTVAGGFCGLVAVAAPNTGTFPPNTSVGFIFLQCQRSYQFDSAVQIAYDYWLTGSVEPRCWIRMRSGTAPGTWGPWRRMYHEGNILGTVSQSSGVPTGAVVERGSNANGEYVRFADGSQFCKQSISDTSQAISNAYVGGFRSAGLNWTYPAAFSVAPFVSASPGDISSGFGAVAVGPSTTATTYIYTAPTSQAAANRTVILFAHGRWF